MKLRFRMIAVSVLVIFVLGALFSAFAQEKAEDRKESKKEEGQPIRIGAIFAITGSASWLGEPERNTAVMYVEEINKAGGINGRPIELIVEDTAGDETTAVNAVRKLISKDKVMAIIGPSRSGTSMAVLPIAEREGIPLLSCAAAESISEPIKKFVFKTPQDDSDAAIRIFEHMKKKGYKKVAIMSGTTSFGSEGRKQLLKYAPEFGMEIVADETYAPADTDMTPQIKKIQGTGAEALVNWSIVPAQAIVAKNLRQLGLTIPLYQSHGFGNIRYVEAAGAAAEGIIFPAGRLLAAESVPETHPQKSVLMEYKKNYEARFKDPASTFGGHAYDALHILVAAINRIEDEITPAKIRDEIEKTKGFVGTGGIFNYSPEDHCGLTKEAFEMLTVKNGKFVVLED